MSHKKLLHKHKQKTKKTQKIDKKIITESKRQMFSTKLFHPPPPPTTTLDKLMRRFSLDLFSIFFHLLLYSITFFSLFPAISFSIFLTFVAFLMRLFSQIFSCFLELHKNRMWFLSNISLQQILVNQRKAICGERNRKFKDLPKREIKIFDNALVISHSQKRWSIVSSSFLQNGHRGEDDFPKMKTFSFK